MDLNMLTKYGNNSVSDVELFDYETGRHITTLSTLIESVVRVGSYKGYLYMKDALYDINLLSYIGKEEERESLTDYEKAIKHSESIRKTITLGKQMREKRFKAIARCAWRDNFYKEDHLVTFEIPYLVMSQEDIDFQGSNINVSEFDLLLKIKSFNEDGDLVKIHIEQSKE